MTFKQRFKKYCNESKIHYTYKKLRKEKEKRLKKNNCDLQALLFYDVKGILKEKAKKVNYAKRCANIK